MTFEMVDDLGKNVAADTDSRTGNMRLTHWGFQAAFDYYGSRGWIIAHEMGHLFDQRGAKGNPNLYFSNVFVEVLNGGCAHVGRIGCLGTEPTFWYLAANWFQGKGEYQPMGQTTSYALQAGSLEDFAESFAPYTLGDPNNMISADRESIIQIDIAVIVSYSQ